MGYDKYGEIHNQYAALPARMHNSEMWLQGSGAVRTNGYSANNGLTGSSTGAASVGLGGTMITSTSVTNTTTRKVDFSSYKSTWEGYSGCAGPQGSAGYSGIGGHSSSRSKAISYTNLSGLSNFSTSSRKPAQSSMGSRFKK